MWVSWESACLTQNVRHFELDFIALKKPGIVRAYLPPQTTKPKGLVGVVAHTFHPVLGMQRQADVDEFEASCCGLEIKACASHLFFTSEM